MPLKFVNGVHDSEFSAIKHFYPLKQYAEKMYEKYPDRMPEPSSWNLQSVDENSLKYSFERKTKNNSINFEMIQNKIEWVQKWQSRIESLKNLCSSINTTLSFIRKQRKDHVRFKPRHFNFRGLIDLNQNIEEIIEEAESESSFNTIEISREEFSTLVKNNYFSKLEQKADETTEELKIQIKRFHEVAENQNKNKIEKIEKICLEILSEFFLDLYLVKIDKNIAKTAIEISNIENKQDKQKIKNQVIKSLKE